jgi:hypothetical protein
MPTSSRSIVAFAALALAACSSGPVLPGDMAADVGRLESVVPLVEELRASDFENSPYCRNLGYARGVFGDLAQDGCARDGTQPFDAIAVADHARVAEAITTADVPATRIRTATFDPHGGLQTAWFVLQDGSITEDQAYLYDPANTVPKVNAEGGEQFTRLDDAWWFVRSPDD